MKRTLMKCIVEVEKTNQMEFNNEKAARNEIVRVMRIVCSQGMIRSSDGNISIRLDEDHFLVTPSGLLKWP